MLGILLGFSGSELAGAETYTVSGRVTGPDGAVESIKVAFDCCATEWMVSTDKDGIYRFTTNGPQRASIIVLPTLESELGQAALLVQVDRNIDNANFHLERGTLLGGRLINKSGFPVRLDHDLFDSQGAKHALQLNEYAEFALFLPPDKYRLTVPFPGYDNQYAVDLRSGDVPFWEVLIDIPSELLPAPADLEAEEIPPCLANITFEPPNDAGFIQIVGAPGAVPEKVPRLDIINLHTGGFITTPVQANGSFSATILAPYGSALQLRYNNSSPRYFRSAGTGSILWILPPDLAKQESVRPVHVTGRAGDSRGYWTATGTINQNRFAPGALFSASLTAVIKHPNVDNRFDDGNYRLVVVLNFERFFDATGRHHARILRGTSTTFTPTGLPIDSMPSARIENYTPLSLKQELVISAIHRSGSTLNFKITLTGNMPKNLPAGVYRPALVLLLGPAGGQTRLAGNRVLCSEDSLETRAELGVDENRIPGYLPVIRVGEPAVPRLPWALFADKFSNGTRGTVAREERGLVGLSNRTAFQAERFIIPPRDRFGRNISYRLEPFIPTLSSSLAGDVEAYPPIIPLKFPAGQLQVKVIRPDGQTDDLGSEMFQQARNGMVQRRYDYFIGADRTLQKVFQATTLSERFTYAFAQYGLYRVLMTGTVEDVWGNIYQGGGTYEVWVAQTLDLESAVFPGQPFEVGDSLATAVIVQPSVPAKVNVAFTLVPAGGSPITFSTSGQASLHGYFQPSGPSFKMPEPGEYLLDVTAEYTDEHGVLWLGASRGAGVVETPKSPMTAHGLRGITVFTDVRPAWFLSSQIHPKGLKENTPDTREDDRFMLLYPYFSGDILWVPDRGNSIIAELSVQDPIGWYSGRLRSHEEQVPYCGRTVCGLDERDSIGELPLITTTTNGWDWTLFPELIDLWGYAYLSTQRPGVSVRGYVGMDNLFRTYWSTDYKYERQLGNGDEGDIANDIKLQYGGAVIRSADRKEYLGYASMEVLIPFGTDELGSRTFPPFQGQSGGPDGGPILTLRGERIDLFLTPTALRPGSVLEVGDTVAVAGTMWPTLDSKGWFTFTAPSGAKRTISGRANRFGYFYSAEGNFRADEPGIWSVEARLLHDGIVPSTGLPPSAHNTGDLLGARPCTGRTDPVGCGQFYFYVTERNEPVLSLEAPSQRVAPAGPIRFEGSIPAGWTQVRGTFTAVMSGFILEEGELLISSDKFRYAFDRLRLHRDCPNLDIPLADTFTISMMLEGTMGGAKMRRAASITLQGGDVSKMGPPGKATLVAPTGAIVTSTPDFVWHAVPTATWYLLYVNDASTSSGKIIAWYTAAQAGCASETGTCSVTPTTALVVGSARWWIQTWNNAGYGPWSDGMSFAVSESGPPGKATLVSPSGTITTTTPNYVWNAVSGASWYLLWVNSAAGSGTIERWYSADHSGCASGTGTCAVTPATILPIGVAQWWIQTWNDAGYGPWSDGMSFSVSSAAGTRR